MKKDQREEKNSGCFSWLLRLKRSVDERWARERNTFMKKFHRDNGKSLAADKLLNETGTPDLLISKVPLCTTTSLTHQEQTTEPVIRGLSESKEDANAHNDEDTNIAHSVTAESDNDGALVVHTDTDSDSVSMISEGHDYTENNFRVDVITPMTSGIVNGLSGSDFNTFSVVITCPVATSLNQQGSMWGEVTVAIIQDEHGAPIEYSATVSMF